MFGTKSKTLVVIPAFNEELSVAAVVSEIRERTGLDVLVVNDMSSDETTDEAESAGATVLNLCCQLGAWGATQTGIRYALQKGYARCVTCDADGQHDVNAISALLAESKASNSDIVIGSCISRGSAARHIAWKYFKVITGLPVNDLTSGFRVYSFRAMQKVALSRASIIDYQDISVLLLLKSQKMTFKEVDVCMVAREDGKSRIFNSWLAVAKYMMLSSIIALCRISK
ncbi:glycosyltransferase family 2 protein [Desulfovibrio sp. JC022]|uniref:glycosyltransferase family 2 protein n=1 Tax=Desulfovibrio sp. JC022 TaxID=2593642 RepID=UPI0013D6A653|nr:glycosyltransferase family 2 protein [Desulfovibrio sp. JC022]NDV24924.1 glycosyltransferase family 2 protein [Desulfovibrio sp. JC022]